MEFIVILAILAGLGLKYKVKETEWRLRNKK